MQNIAMQNNVELSVEIFVAGEAAPGNAGQGGLAGILVLVFDLQDAARAGARRIALEATSGETAPGRSGAAPGMLALDPERHRASIDGKDVTLTALEFRLLLWLFQRPDVTHSREVLLSSVWGWSAQADTRTVDTHVTRLRRKLGSAARQIQTVRGIGYRFLEQPSDAEPERVCTRRAS